MHCSNYAITKARTYTGSPIDRTASVTAAVSEGTHSAW